ncbi:MAG: type III pantothenate kinase [Caldithrix sp.]|nr:type III pantothenate kinase [Caldithrix sp.]
MQGRFERLNMLLAIDIGNTHTVFGLFGNKQLVEHWRLFSEINRTEDEIAATLAYLLQKKKVSLDDVNGICISSVVPDLTSVYQYLAQRYFKITPLIINHDLDLSVKIVYKNPDAVGSDRLCNAVAGVKYYGKPLIIIDFGTASVIDCINPQGDYLGGVIMPGISSSINTLHKRAAKLPKVELTFPEHIIGRSTDESIQSGILYGTVFMLEGFIQSIQNDFGKNTRVVATGGMAGQIAERMDAIDHVDPSLNLKGIALIYSKNRKL